MAQTTINYVSTERLGYYDTKIKEFLAAQDAAVKAELNESISAVNTALSEEVTRAKAQETTNAAAAAEAKAAADQAQSDVNALSEKVGTVEDGKTVMGIIEQIQENAYDDTELRGLISDLDTNKADKTQVATDIAAAVKVETDARVEAVAGVQGAVDTLSETHATDKKALEDAIALKADITALNEVSAVANAAVKQTDYDTKVAALEAEDTRIAGLVATEQSRAEEVEEDLTERIETMEAFWDAAQADGTDSNVIDTLKEIQEYIASDESGASAMAASIKQNADDIDALETLVGTTSVESQIATAIANENLDQYATDEELAGAVARVAALETANAEGGAVATAIADAKAAADQAQEDVDALEEVVATKASQADLNTVSGKVTTLEGEMDDVQAAVATKASQDDLTAATGRITTVEGKVSTLESEMDQAQADIDAVEAKAVANETAIGTKAAQTDLEAAVARIAELESVTHVEIETSAIDAWFEA